MGMFRLRFDINPQNFEKLDEMRARLQDFTVPFVNIIAKWARGNVRRKFARGAGAELSGVDQAPAAWLPVTLAYYKQKHGPIVRGDRPLFPDWLMVRTGALRAALGTRGAFAEYVDAHKAVFGTPLAPESAAAAAGNRESRLTIFLDRTDRGMVRRELQQYLSLGAGYKELMWNTARRKTGLRKEALQMDMDFAATI
ncbi:MAG: hypothetical protein WC822_06990 [Candidatus Paceibacterota bacterium]|jgi:hypothetical protein